MRNKFIPATLSLLLSLPLLAADTPPLRKADYSIAFWPDGFIKGRRDVSSNILAIETGYYGFTIDTADFSKCRYGRIEGPGYYAASRTASKMLSSLKPSDLKIEIEQGGKVYRALSCLGGRKKDSRHTILMESGRFAQRYHLKELQFVDGSGNILTAKSTLEIVAWPSSLTFNLKIEKINGPENSKMRMSMEGRTAEAQASVNSRLTLNIPLPGAADNETPVQFTVKGTTGRAYSTNYRNDMGAYVVDIRKLDRNWKSRGRDIREYDELAVTINNAGKTQKYAPVLFDIRGPANITGQVPILCDAEGRPTGIPVQLSKNWHHGVYSKFYAIIPAAPGETNYRLRIAYGFWGTLPSASHAQLCLLGYGGNGRWDQLAIGCWGETMCLDMDHSLRDMMVTDVRMLYTRNGKNGAMWTWSDGGWGGDWLGIYRDSGRKLLPVDLKTAYLAHGPCLTDVRYSGFHGVHHDVAFDADVSTLRTDDYNRVFQKLRYRFNRELPADRAHLFRMGPNHELVTPRIAYGNRDGLIAEHDVPADLTKDAIFKNQTVLTGEGPWWVAFPGSYLHSRRRWGTGSRALIIRSFKAVYGGREHKNPIISFPVVQTYGLINKIGLDLKLLVPPEVTGFKSGDSLEMDMEWITVPRVADDYYGPNDAFKEHLQQNPESWKTVHREAAGNALNVSVQGGKLLQRYPVVIRAEQPEVRVDIEGGLGIVPIRFEGLSSATTQRLYSMEAKPVPLDQSVNGNDFWQTDYDAESGTYRMSFNLPLDGIRKSTWLLAR